MSNDFRPVLKILLRFIILYLLLLSGYQFYLNTQSGHLDVFSKTVGSQSSFVQQFLGYPTYMVEEPARQTSWFFVQGKPVSRMVEGCNAISVMILFTAFVFGFYSGRKTFLFAAAGLVFLHIMNVLRIAGLNILLVEWPQYSKMGHDYLFPAIIYGSVVLLWLVWIRFFALKDVRREKV